MDKLFQKFNDTSVQLGFSSDDLKRDSNFIFCTIGYLIPILFFLPIVVKKDSSFGKFHANQQLTWLIFTIVAGVACGILAFIPFIGALLMALVEMAILVVSVLLFIAALQGYAVRIPFIGNLISIF